MSRPFRIASVLAVTLVLAVAATGCDKGPAAPRSYPDTAAGFDQFARALIATVKDNRRADYEAMARALTPPDAKAWFETTFGAETGARVLAEYEGYGIKDFAKAWPDLRRLVIDDGRDTVNTTRHTDPNDELATGYQANALRAMKQPAALYRIQLVRADGSKSFTLWSFVHIDGQFRLVGQMKKASPPSDDGEFAKELDLLGELPVAEARKLMKEMQER
jgi:hypothetical protein